MNLGCEAGLEFDTLHMGTMVLSLEILVLDTKPSLGKCLPWKSEHLKPNPFGVIPLVSLRLSAPLSIAEAMDIPNTENPQRKASEFELGSVTQMQKSRQVSIFCWLLSENHMDFSLKDCVFKLEEWKKETYSTQKKRKSLA